MKRITIGTSLTAVILAQALPIPLDQLINAPFSGKAHTSNEYTGWAKLDPRDFETLAAQSVGNYTNEKIDLIGAGITILTSYEYESGYLRVFGTLDKKFRWHQESNPNSFTPKSSTAVVKDGKKKVYIT
jgi:hypothetical protein